MEVPLQALAAGKPVLVPDRGVLSYRTVRHQIGRVYHPGRFADLQTQWGRLRAEPEDAYSARIATFMENFSRERLMDALVGALRGRTVAGDPLQPQRQVVPTPAP
jgi:glycosyltransferase involved in cell wall biosynthesis